MASALWPGLLRQDGVCPARLHDLHQHVQRATVHAGGDRECRGLLCVALQLGLLHATGAPPDLMHRQEPAGRLVDVHDAVFPECVLVHQPTKLDEHSVRVGLLQSRAVELFQALGWLLEAQAHATQEPSDPLSTVTNVMSLCVEPAEHQDVDREPTEAEDIGDPHNVLAEPCHVCGLEQTLPAMRCCRAAFPAVRSVLVDPVEQSGTKGLDLTQGTAVCAIAVPSTAGTCR